ncbi:unnamed protein product, partial [Symbiodinium pilosum]
ALLPPMKTQLLLQAHRRMVRCLVPRDKLFEVDASDTPNVDTAKLAKFLGFKPPRWDPPFPRIRLPEPKAATLQLPSKKGKKGKKGKKEHSSISGKSLALCITGQLKRLELKSKIKNVIEPAQAAGLNVRVAAVLDPAADP